MTHATTFTAYLGAFGDDNPQDAAPSNFTIGVSWGDGTTSSAAAKFNKTTGHWDLTGTHRYGAKGTYALAIQVRDTEGFSMTVHSSAVVT